MSDDILTQIKDACDRAVAEGYTLERGVFGIGTDLMTGLFRPMASGCMCALGAVLNGTKEPTQTGPYRLYGFELFQESASRALGISSHEGVSFRKGFDEGHHTAAEKQFYETGHDVEADFYKLGHACALYYVDGVRL